MMKNLGLWLMISLSSLLSGCSLLFHRPTFQTTEQRQKTLPLRIPHLQKQAHLYWNDFRVPFIEAQTDADGAYLLGVVQTHLRWGQMELMRIISQGRLAEVAGPLAIDIDHTLRMINFSKDLEQREKLLPPETKAWLENYVRGINVYIEQQKELPSELIVAGLPKTPWKVADILRLSRLIAVDFSWIYYLQWNKLKDDKTWPLLKTLFDQSLLDSPPSFDPMKPDQLKNYLLHFSKSGSNSLVISGKKSKSGSGLIANDPHLGIFAPNLWLLVGLKCPSYHGVGFQFAGLPVFTLGRTPLMAWGGTNMRGISTHLYSIEDNDPSLTTRVERIKVRGYWDQELKIRESKYGPLISDSKYFKHQKNIALQWVGHRTGTDEITAFLKVTQARHFEEFRQAFKNYGVSAQNFLYADQRGDIGQILAYQQIQFKSEQTLLTPIKKSEEFSEQVLTSTELPFSYNPKNSFIASANNRPVPTALPIAFSYSNADRIQRLQKLVSEKAIWSVEDLKILQQDTYSESALRVLTYWKKEFQSLEGLSNDEKFHLKDLWSWDAYYLESSTGAVLFELTAAFFYERILKENYSDTDIRTSLYSSDRWKELILNEMNKISKSQLQKYFVSSFHSAVQRAKEYPRWGDYHRQNFQHPFGYLPILGSRYRILEYGTSGGNDTIFKSAHSLSTQQVSVSYGANARHVSDLSDPDENYFVLLGGQDGWLMNPHLSDQIELWRRGKYMRLPLNIETIRREFKTKNSYEPGLE